MPNRGDLRVWWVPQVPMKAFSIDVANLVEAKLLLDTLARYDQFQYDNNVKGDYANVGGLNVYIPELQADSDSDEVDGFFTWYSEDGSDFDNFTLEDIRANPPKWEGESNYFN